MRVRTIALAFFFAAILAAPAQADEIGGGGFTVPQDEWLWGIEGLVRTPVDLAAMVGVGFSDWEFDAEIQFLDASSGLRQNDKVTDIDPVAWEAGFRLAGGIGYWNCCVLFEPAMSFRYQNYGGNRSDQTGSAFDGSEPFERAFAQLEIDRGWELGFGPQMSFVIRDSTPLVGSHLGLAGRQLVFFPYIGVAHSEWDSQITAFNPVEGDGVRRRNSDFEDESFMFGFDLDIPLPGSHADFTHAFVFGFRYVDSDDQHDMGPFSPENNGTGTLGTSGTPCSASSGGDSVCANFEEVESWRIGLYYKVTWNDFEGFVKRNIFGPVN